MTALIEEHKLPLSLLQKVVLSFPW